MSKITLLALLFISAMAAGMYAHYRKPQPATASSPSVSPTSTPSVSPTLSTSASPTPAPATSPATGTLQGKVTIGPNCPVEQVGNPCTPTSAQYTSQTIIISDAATGKEVTRVHPDTAGHYSVALNPGNYKVVSEAYQNNPNNQVVTTISVQAGQTSTLNLSIDTGIR